YHSPVSVRGEERDFCWIQYPISEGLIDRTFSLAIAQLVKKALTYQPFLMGLGVGSLEEDWAKFMVLMKWRRKTVPFLFLPINATRVMRGMNYFKTRPSLRLGAAVGAYIGGGLAASAVLTMRRWVATRPMKFECREEPLFNGWADQVYGAARGEYG